ncbi:MAG TPA: sterol desaturase family protein [Alphaproteobacteria bacterium]|nr:sterol desaturase family protein [Alphaproteobacteria bacterium]
MDGSSAVVVAVSFLTVAFVFLIGQAIERLRPVQLRQPRSHLALDVAYAIAQQIIFRSTAPFWGSIAVGLVNAAGGGLISLRADGAWWLASLLSYLLVADLLEYLWHRAQHAWKPLWEMHSFHHSEESINALTAFRHFWLEFWIKTVVVYPLLGILFKTPPIILGVASMIYFASHVWVHLNIRVPAGRMSFCLATPQYHRIHHSMRPEHLNKNFADLLPFWDVLFGTAWRPSREEFPDTGLAPSDLPDNVLDALLWPFRHDLRFAAVRLSARRRD